MHKVFFVVGVALCGLWTGVAASPASAAPAPSPSPSASASAAPAPTDYEKFVKGAERQDGIFTLWHKDGKVYLEIADGQLDTDYLEHIVPANGLGGFGFHSGDQFTQDARLVRFHLVGKSVAMIWPHTRFLAQPGTPLATAVRESTADSVEAMLPVTAENTAGKTRVLDLSPLLGDLLDLGNNLSGAVENPRNPGGGYHLDPSRSYFGPSKDFPENAIVEADETFASAKPDAIDTVPDARFVQMRVKYDFAKLAATPDYMPRLYDDRVGFWEDPHISFDDDVKRDNHLFYILRWNVQPSDPTQKLSPPKKPIVFYLDRSIPMEYRAPIRDGILEWNKAFERIGISNAIVVKDAPDDPAWDPDDIRNSVVRWVTDAQSEFGAEAQITWDPRTGEVFRGGVLLDSNLVRFAKNNERVLLAGLGLPSGGAAANEIEPPAMPSSYAPAHDERAFAMGEEAQAAFGETALTLMGQTGDLDGYVRDRLKAVTMHEVGHDFGLSHNFIAHNAYTTRELKDRTFTKALGTSASVMDYWPVNIWPKGSSQGTYFPTTLGTYDYHVIHWGYADVPGATTPQAEVPTLSRWASSAFDPRYAFAGDEDGEYDGHAIDPRTAPFVLTDRPIDWCGAQLDLTKSLFASLDSRFPRTQQPWDDERAAFLSLFARYATCASTMTHYIGGEYLSRGRVGDPGVTSALAPVSRAEEVRAFGLLDRYVLSDAAWNVSPRTLNRMTYTEYMPFANFGYDPTPRHDVPIVDLIGAFQNQALGYLFSPLLLQRLADLPTKDPKPGATMSLADLFTWTQHAVYGDLGALGATEVHRNLQRRYARMLARMVTEPVAGTPLDAQALARYELTALSGDVARAQSRRDLDLQTRAHLAALRVDVDRALEARTTLPAVTRRWRTPPHRSTAVARTSRSQIG